MTTKLMSMIAALNLLACLCWGQPESECLAKGELHPCGTAALRNYAKQLADARTTDEMNSLTEALVKERRETSFLLNQILTTSANNELKIRACYLLGVFRSEYYISSVVANIGLKATLPTELTARPRWLEYPCKEALERIGRPAERDLLVALGEAESSELRHLMVEALLKISGPERVSTMLRDAESEATEEAVRRRLREAMKILAGPSSQS